MSEIFLSSQKYKIHWEFVPFDQEVGKSIEIFKTDCSVKKNCEESTKKAFEKFGKINHMVYSVAFFGSKSLDAQEEDWNKSLSVNVAGAGYMISAVVPYMKCAKQVLILFSFV